MWTGLISRLCARDGDWQRQFSTVASADNKRKIGWIASNSPQAFLELYKDRMHGMSPGSALQETLSRLAAGDVTPREVVEQALARANSNAGRNVFIGLDVEKALSEADELPARFRGAAKPALYGLPVSLKDLFDLQGFPTSCGSRFYAERDGAASQDSAA